MESLVFCVILRDFSPSTYNYSGLRLQDFVIAHNAANDSKNTSAMVFTIAVGLLHHTLRLNFDPIRLGTVGLLYGFEGKKEHLSSVCMRMVPEVDRIVVLTPAKSAFSPDELG
jgi:hypothetical protein